MIDKNREITADSMPIPLGKTIRVLPRIKMDNKEILCLIKLSLFFIIF